MSGRRLDAEEVSFRHTCVSLAVSLDRRGKWTLKGGFGRRKTGEGSREPIDQTMFSQTLKSQQETPSLKNFPGIREEL